MYFHFKFVIEFVIELRSGVVFILKIDYMLSESKWVRGFLKMDLS